MIMQLTQNYNCTKKFIALELVGFITLSKSARIKEIKKGKLVSSPLVDLLANKDSSIVNQLQ